MFVTGAWRGSSPRGRLPGSMSVASTRPAAAAASTLPPLEMPALPPRSREELSFVEGSRYPSAPEPVCVQDATGEIISSRALASRIAETFASADDRHSCTRNGGGQLREPSL